MSTDKGYVKIYRGIRDHWIWDDEKALKAWIDMIMLANHHESKTFFNGRMVTVERGSFITSVRNLAKRWGWGKDKVLRFLRDLEADSMIDRKADTKKTLITLVKYSFYQDYGQKKQTPTRTRPRTLTGTQTGTQTSHSEYIKEGQKTLKKKKKEIIPELEPDDEYDLEGWEDP